jgi:hypothetical protein
MKRKINNQNLQFNTVFFVTFEETLQIFHVKNIISGSGEKQVTYEIVICAILYNYGLHEKLLSIIIKLGKKTFLDLIIMILTFHEGHNCIIILN